MVGRIPISLFGTGGTGKWALRRPRLLPTSVVVWVLGPGLSNLKQGSGLKGRPGARPRYGPERGGRTMRYEAQSAVEPAPIGNGRIRRGLAGFAFLTAVGTGEVAGVTITLDEQGDFTRAGL